MFLNGTAMSGQKDHFAVNGATFLGPTSTAPGFRFFAVRREFPGLLPVSEHGVPVSGELYDMSDKQLFDVLLPQEPEELELGMIELSDGATVHAMILQPDRLAPGDEVVDIADFGGWRAFQAHLTANERARDLLNR
ncbi:gamma-glutamylcyclotransferase [Actinomadura graeca]|uniref:Gamma-glutamylcyclotransferase n=1 Tax=Actinomadura graeca TaxID=2750812 RepID=A0ABX8QUX5_9ACTN|nr:gamma-glutamylcyclotransferase [Actinomadura graeca]QXJ22545.1 gamma-glutamylcyclotransferase [Actinomadura graeca]